MPEGTASELSVHNQKCREFMVNPGAVTDWRQCVNAPSFHFSRPLFGDSEGLVELSTRPALLVFPPFLFQPPCPAVLPLDLKSALVLGFAPLGAQAKIRQ